MLYYYVDFGKTTDGHSGSFRDMFSLNDLQAFLDSLPNPFTQRITFRCRGRAVGKLVITVIGDGVGDNKNLLRFESIDPVNDIATLVVSYQAEAIGSSSSS